MIHLAQREESRKKGRKSRRKKGGTFPSRQTYEGRKCLRFNGASARGSNDGRSSAVRTNEPRHTAAEPSIRRARNSVRPPDTNIH